MMQSVVSKEWHGKTAEDYLRHELGVSRRLLTKLKRQESGMLRNGALLRTVDILSAGDRITLAVGGGEQPLEPNGELFVPIAYEDDEIVVFDKPAGMPVHPSIRHYSDTLGNYFSYLYNEFSFRPVNRLDRDTSGLCLVAKNAYAANWFSRHVQKTYYAVVLGEISAPGRIDAPIGRQDDSVILRCVRQDGQPAVTLYEPVCYQNGHTLLKIRLETGRTHQIRVHLSHIGFPLPGDSFYGGDLSRISRQALHCGELRLTFRGGGEVLVKSPLPPDMEKLLSGALE